MAILTGFNLCAAAACAGAGMRLVGAAARAAWASKLLYRIAMTMCWGMVALAGLSTALAWSFWSVRAGYGLIVLVPLVWLVLMGAVFAIVDFAEDGVFDFGRGAPPKN